MQDHPEHQDGAGTRAMRSVTGGTPHQSPAHPGEPSHLGGHPHGKRSSWVLIGLVVIAFLAGGASLILHIWWLFWACLGVVLLAVPAGKAIRIMDDTVVYDSTAAPHDSPLQERGDSG